MKTRSGKVKNGATAKNRFHYISRTSHFRNYKESASEQIEFVRSGNLPNFAEGKPAEFWQAADQYERSNGRTCSSLVVALPKELTQAQRIELAEHFIAEFVDRYKYPFTCAIHNHSGSIGGIEQPHLHLMYSERHVDGIERTAEQFFKRYNPKEPEKGGAQKLTADVLGMGKAQLQLYRQKTEELINNSLQRYAPTKIVNIRGIEVEVPSFVSCLSNHEYNKKHGTQLQDVPMMNKAVRFATAKEPELFEKQQSMMQEIRQLRDENNYMLYQSYYMAELTRRNQLEAEKRQELEDELRQKSDTFQDVLTKDQVRAEYFELLPEQAGDRQYLQKLALDKMLMLQEQMIQTLRDHPSAMHSPALISENLTQYVELLKTAHLDRITNLEKVKQLQSSLITELEPNSLRILDDIHKLQSFLSRGGSIHLYDPSKPVETKMLRQDHGYDGPSF